MHAASGGEVLRIWYMFELDKWMYGWMYGWMDECKNRWMDKCEILSDFIAFIVLTDLLS